MEALATVAIIGIIAAIAAGSYGRMFETSRLAMAEHRVEYLNQAILRYDQIEGAALTRVPADDDSSDDEIAVLRALQYDDPADPQPGAPYFRQDYDPSGSGDSDEFRAVWNGAFYELREPGQSGSGLLIVFDASDLGDAITFDADFVPLAGY